jgi:SAM-dependent methyltransferase
MATKRTPQRRRYAWLVRLGITPSLAQQRRRALEEAIEATARRAPGLVAVLDAGCGHRSPLVPFRSRIDRLVGADLLTPRSRLPYLDEFRNTDLCAAEGAFDAGTFDVVLSNFALEHLVDPPAALANFYLWLRPGGQLVLTTVNRRHPFVAFYLWLPERIRRRLQPRVKASAEDAHHLVGACNDPATIRNALTRSIRAPPPSAHRQSRAGVGSPCADVRARTGGRPLMSGEPRPTILAVAQKPDAS